MSSYQPLFLFLSAASCAWFVMGSSMQAQIVVDGTTQTLVNGCPGGRCQIRGSSIVSDNLFHSFHEFSVPAEGAVFDITATPTLQNILTRVTGSLPSQINGRLLVSGGTGATNLFVINPNGIFFGLNAFLDVRGSFLASSASAIQFADGSVFSATNPTPPTLTMQIPTGLQFGAAIPGSITVDRSQLIVPSSGLTRQTLALIGGDVTIIGRPTDINSAGVRAPGGRVELGSVGPNQVLGLIPTDRGWNLNYSNTNAFQDITLTQIARVLATNGSVNIQGGNLSVLEGSSVFANSIVPNNTTPSAQPGESITVTTTDSVRLSGFGGTSLSGLFANRFADTSANIAITTRQLIVENGAAVRTQNSDRDSGGTITLNVDRFTLQNASISATTFSQGNAGNLIINATEEITVSGAATTPTGFDLGGIFSRSTSSNPAAVLGSAGNVTITTPKLTLQSGALISVASQSNTNVAGNVTINAPTILLNQASIRADSRAGQGNVTLNSQDIRLRDNSQISTNATGTAEGGNITIATNTLLALENSDITANSQESFGGRVSIRAQAIFGTAFRPQLTPESDITATSALGPQFSGTVTIQTPDVDPSSGLVDLEPQVLDIAGLVAQSCSTGGQRATSEFTIVGRGGLPTQPTDPLTGDTILTDLGKPVSNRGRMGPVGVSTETPQPEAPIVQAQGWVVNAQGKVVLVAQAPNVALQGSWLSSTGCNAF
ncbi:MAG: filamentous hemagglutinin N-terminal domain-containing protein [Leptolyngbyaceae cyanobacterium bins.59]|nr:filamentous hemagglutinin N-terminal domain-containing protein [Leptolyngbyaceae cyanobacterium bins.59]